MNRAEISGRLGRIYTALLRNFGPQGWWPGETPFETCVGAILTQNTSWKNVARAIDNLKKADLLEPRRLLALSDRRVASLIRPSGYFNLKARRLKNFLRFLVDEFKGSVDVMAATATATLRERLLAVKGIGRETADSILLYACHHPAFVVDAYTYRIFLRHEMVDETADYDELQDLFMRNLERDPKFFNEFHALLVHLGKEYCLKGEPRCLKCPLYDDLPERTPLRRPTGSERVGCAD